MPVPETGSKPASREGGEDLQVTKDCVGSTYVLRLRGELDLQTVPRLRVRLAEALEQGTGAVIVDLSKVTFIDSTGLAALLNALRRLTRAQRRLLLVCAEGPVLRMLKVTRLDSTFTLFGSTREALASLPPAKAVA